MSEIKPIAFYLPQYHPIPENDYWWGKGFTEWTNVTSAKQQFKGHYQPHLPADLGFYDLRLAESRQAQADMARAYGIYGFCYYHYWFHGKQLLERPFQEVLKSGQPDFPFCLCWPNESWGRSWDGNYKDLLIEQTYSIEDHLAHIRWLAEAFSDPRYIRVDGKPLFLVYRASYIPNLQSTLDLWRTEALRLGLGELFLARVESGLSEKGTNPVELGFDAAVEFQPNWQALNDLYGPWIIKKLRSTLSSTFSRNKCFDYQEVVNKMISLPNPDYLRFPCVTPMWDNSARKKKGGAIILTDSTPEKFGQWLNLVLQRLQGSALPEKFLFINAWNEWAEGCHLEPCQKWGKQYLETLSNELSLIKS
ncbi:MAG: glycoside hydrolase family 99-like domain-containing protein [Haliscomenobacter sp.]|uniref:glycoside hydrolase family 99-like domain-containing protein n=1 Tax=Haliscomenobacter sp. TaxID=2717303 RepID=UPI0029BC7C1D|nr:glycoside hydrolase family 99-like domain-containing protein [Haliscomenobacter sp.]MDX2069002.1 glycoside hydrolase family 99-like domain-containing protein [Haliscomenobacter sp.]